MLKTEQLMMMVMMKCCYFYLKRHPMKVEIRISLAISELVGFGFHCHFQQCRRHFRRPLKAALHSARTWKAR